MRSILFFSMFVSTLTMGCFALLDVFYCLRMPSGQFYEHCLLRVSRHCLHASIHSLRCLSLMPDPSKNRPGIPVEFQRNSRSSLDSGRSPPEFRATETRNSGFRWIPGSEFWSPADSGIRVLESGGIPGLEFCYVMAFQSRVWSPAEFRVWSSGVRLKIWGPAEFQTLSLAASQCSYYRCMDALKVFH